MILLILIFTMISGCVSYDYDRRRRVSREPERERIEKEHERLSLEEDRIKEERERLVMEEKRIQERSNGPLRETRRRTRRLRSQRNPSRIETSTLEIGGDFEFSRSSFKVDVDGEQTIDIDSTTLDTTLLYYIAPDVGLGVLFFVEDVSGTSGGDSIDVRTGALGPLASMNIGLNELTSFRLFGSVFISNTQFTDSSGASGKADGIGLILGGGPSYFITDDVSLNGLLTYTRFSLDAESTDIGVDIDGLSLGVGLSVYLR